MIQAVENCYIRGKDIQPFFIDNSDPVYIDSSLFDELSQFHLSHDDLLITVVGMKFGKVAVIGEHDIPSIFSCKSTLIRNSKINVWYLLTYLSCDIGYGLIRRGQRGAAQPGINLFDIESVPVPLFSEIFQTKIESLVKKSRELTDKSSAYYSEAQKYLVAELGLDNCEPQHQLTFARNYSEIKKAERLDAEYFQPKYGEIIRAIRQYPGGSDTLENLAYIKKCIEVGSNEYVDEGIPFARVSNLSPFEITEEKYISNSLYEKLTPEETDVPFTFSKNHQPQMGEILFTKDGTPGVAYYLSEQPPRMIPSGGILRLKNKSPKIINEYLALVLNSVLVKEQVNRDVGGSIILHWRPEQVKKTIVPILNKDKQLSLKYKINKSFQLRENSKKILEYAKKGVVLAIEKDENTALKWLKVQEDEFMA